MLGLFIERGLVSIPPRSFDEDAIFRSGICRSLVDLFPRTLVSCRSADDAPVWVRDFFEGDFFQPRQVEFP